MSLLEQSQKWYPTHVKVVVIQARGLRSKGKDGTNDAYAIMQLGKEKYSSSVTEKSTEPLWREEAEFELPLLQQASREKCTLYLMVMHRALVGLDKFLGQAAINLSELYDSKTRNKVGWYKLHSKSGKMEKDRGEIEADIRFVRNNMTASMFDLSMKDKSRSTLGRLKDKFKGKRKEGFSDSVSAVVPSTSTAGDSDEEPVVTEKKKKSKLKMLFPKSNLQRTSLSQSMSVIPTGPSSPAANTNTKKAKDFGNEDFTEIKLHDSADEESSSKTLYVPKILSHKRAASADTKQLNFASGGVAKKDTLSLFGGLKPKNDPVSQSNLCINGSHVYTEEPNQIVHGKPKSDSKPLHSSQFYTSTEDLPSRFSAEPLETSNPFSSSKSQSETSLSEPTYKSATLPVFKTLGNASDLSDPQKSDRQEKEKEKEESKHVGPLPSGGGKKEVGKKTETIAVPAGGTKSLNPFDDDDAAKVEEERKTTPVPRADPVAKKEEAKRGGLMSLFPRKIETSKAPELKETKNPFEDAKEEVKKPASSSVWSSRTAAIKPKLEVSPKAETKAEPLSSSPSVPDSPPFSPAIKDPYSSAPPIVLGTGGLSDSNFTSLHESYSPPPKILAAQPPPSVNAKYASLESLPPSAKELGAAPLLLLPSANSSSSSSSSPDTATSELCATELVGGQAPERRTPKMESSKTPAQLLFRELTRKKPSIDEDQGSSYDRENDPASEIQKYEGLSEGRALETNPECRLESSEGNEERVWSEVQSMYGKPDPACSPEEVSERPRTLLDLNSVPASETHLPRDPPKVPPRSSLSGSEVNLNRQPLFAEKPKVPPTPAPRNVASVNKALANKDSLHPPEDLVSFHSKAECSVEPVTQPSEVRGTDVTVVVGKSGKDSSTSSQEQNDCRVTLVTGFEEQPPTISTCSSCEGAADDYPVTMRVARMKSEIHPSVWPGSLPVIPEKMEGSATTDREAEAASRLESPSPRVPPKIVILVQESEDRTTPDPAKNLATGSEHLGNVQRLERSQGSDSSLQEPSVHDGKSDDAKVFPERKGDPCDRSPTLTDKSDHSKISAEAKNDFDSRVPPESAAKLASSEISFSTSRSMQNNSTLKSSEESFNGGKLRTSKSSVAVPLRSPGLVGSIDSDLITASPALSDSVEFSVSPLIPSLPLSQSTSPVTDDTHLIKPPAGSSPDVEHSGQKRLLQAWVSPTETQPIQSTSSALAVQTRRRPHLVKPMSAAETRLHEVTSEENVKTRNKNVDVMVTKSSTGRSLTVNESQTFLKDYDPSDPAAAYAQLTHDELIQLVLKQKELLAKKDCHVRELESYIDNLLVRVMEETPNILRVVCQPNRKAERV
uniref:rab11 family-interacting protein 1-like n=1 Tax=Pristiophorus japonicus TaxID=55135 RepID=UPI00398F844A